MSGNQKIQNGRQAAIFKVTSLKIKRDSAYGHHQHAYKIWNWNSKANLTYALENMSSTDRRTDKVNPVYPPPTSLGEGIIIEDVMGWQNSKRIGLLSSDDLTPSSQIGWAVPRECNTRMRDPKCSRDCKHGRRSDSWSISVFRGE